MTDPPIRHALPQRQPDVDEALYHKIAARPLRSAMSPFCCATHSLSLNVAFDIARWGKVLFEVIMSMPVWVQVWVSWLILVNTASILFLKRVEARWVLLAWVINAPLIETMLQVFGPTRILGVSHIAVWAPLVVYLWMRRGHWRGMTTWAERWIAVSFVSNSISLVFDYVDLGRYLAENLPG